MGKSSRKQTGISISRWLPLMGVVAIVVMVFIAYWPAIHGDYVWDDEKYVSRNELLTAPDGLQRIWFSTDSPSQYFPLVYTTFRIEHAIWRLETTGYHVDNIILHILNALLIWLILRKLKVRWAWLAAAIFALHPVNVESVAWITERKNVLSTLFYLLTVLSWMRFRDRSDWRFYGLALLSCALALFAKTTACTIPAALLLVSWLRREKIGWRELALMLPFAAFGLAMGMVSMWWEHNKQGTSGQWFEFSIADRVLVASRALWFYLGKLVWPARVAFSYERWKIDPSQPVQYLWLVGCAVVAGMLWWFRRIIGRGPIAAGLFFVAGLVPMLGFFKLFTFLYTFVADHYQYAACIGPIALAAAGLGRLADRSRAHRIGSYALSALMIGVLSVLTWNQAHAYENLEQLWRHTVANCPKAWLAQNNLATVLIEQGRNDEAEPYAEQAVALAPDSWLTNSTVGAVLVNTGRFEEAIPHFEAAIRLRPDWPEPHYKLGVALWCLKRVDEAIAEYQAAIKLRPDDYAEPRFNLAVAFFTQGRLDECIEQYRKLTEIEPGFEGAHRNLAVALYFRGLYADAWSEVRLAERYGDQIDPKFIGALSSKMPEP